MTQQLTVEFPQNLPDLLQKNTNNWLLIFFNKREIKTNCVTDEIKNIWELTRLVPRDYVVGPRKLFLAHIKWLLHADAGWSCPSSLPELCGKLLTCSWHGVVLHSIQAYGSIRYKSSELVQVTQWITDLKYIWVYGSWMIVIEETQRSNQASNMIE